MDLPEIIAGIDARKVRDMFKAFVATETEYVWTQGMPHIVPKMVTVALIETSLGVSVAEAQTIQTELVAAGWLESGKLVPTRSGMALAQHIDRPKLSRAVAEKIVEQVVAWAENTHTDPEARVKVRSIHLYGSLERRAPEVGDIDLFVEFTTMDLGLDLQPEDQEREEELCEELAALSEYISPSDELERMRMEDVPRRQVFPRPAGEDENQS